MAMDDKDRQIQELFDGYADGLGERADLADKARALMTEKRRTERGCKSRRATAREKRRVIFITVGSVAAAAAFGVFAIGVLPKLLIGGNGNPSDNIPDGVAPAPVVSYTLNDVRAVAVTEEFAADYVDLSTLKQYADVFDAHFYACYLETEESPVYVKCVFGVQTDDGMTEMRVISERRGFRRDDLEESYGYLITDNGGYTYSNDYENGEYVTAAYCADRGFNYYFYAQSGDGFADEIIKLIL